MGVPIIIHKNVCDYCKNEELITDDVISFAIHFSTLSTSEMMLKGRHMIGAHKNELSFCCRDCLCEWFKNNMKPNGEIIEVGNGDT